LSKVQCFSVGGVVVVGVEWMISVFDGGETGLEEQKRRRRSQEAVDASKRSVVGVVGRAGAVLVWVKADVV
jgi:hypothetical protein